VRQKMSLFDQFKTNTNEEPRTYSEEVSGPSYYSQPNSTLLLHQQNLSQLQDDFYTLLTGFEKTEDEKGNLIWARKQGIEPLFKSVGANELYRLFCSVINQNTLNSRFDNSRDINKNVNLFATTMIQLVHRNKDRWLKDDSLTTYATALKVVKTYCIHASEMTFRRAINGEERGTSRASGTYSLKDSPVDQTRAPI